jgi:pimeloyl-ACP methyl ester carboxylesterase
MADHADDAAGLIAALGYERAHVLGTSYGGVVAQETAIRHPERVNHLILAAAPHGIPLRDGVPAPVGQSEETERVVKGALAGDEEANRRLNELFFSREAIERDPELLRILPDIRYTRPPELAERRMNAVYGYNSAERLTGIKAPTLVIAGGSDRILANDEPWQMTNEIPGATLVRLAGVGHVWALEAPERVVHIVKAFIADHL